MRSLLVLAVATAFLPACARGALVLNMDGLRGCDPGLQMLELYFDELPPAQDERLAAYTIRLRTLGPTLRFGPSELVGEPVEHPFVFPAGTGVDVLTASDSELFVLATLPVTVPRGVNIPDNGGVLRFPVEVSPSGVGLAGVVIDVSSTVATEFADDEGQLIPFVPVNGQVYFCPEPSSAVVVLLGVWLGALRRRRW